MRLLGGLYLVVDPGLGDDGLAAARAAIRGGVDIVQLLHDGRKALALARKLRELTKAHDLPFLINNSLDLAREVGADGVHIDGTHPIPSDVRNILGKDALVGYTCGNDLEKVRWATKMGADYVSFCSIFPSVSAGECELVPLETVARSRRETEIPIFASGGITHENASKVLAEGVDGIAVISAILKAPNPEESVKRFRRILMEHRTVSARPG